MQQTTSFDDTVAKLTSSASRALSDVIPITATGGADGSPGIWKEHKSDMEAILPGAIVAFKRESDAPWSFGLVATANVVRGPREGHLTLRISTDGGSTFHLYDSAKLQEKVSGIWLGAVSGLPASKAWTLGELEATVTPVVAGRFEQLRVSVAGPTNSGEVMSIEEAARRLGMDPPERWPSLTGTPPVPPTLSGPVALAALEVACAMDAQLPLVKLDEQYLTPVATRRRRSTLPPAES